MCYRCGQCDAQEAAGQSVCSLCGVVLWEMRYHAPTAPVTVYLDPEIARWMARRPGGLGGQIRGMMLEAYERKEQRFKGGLV